MKSKRMSSPRIDSVTMVAGSDAGRQDAAVRAQAELIELLARLVLASVERVAATGEREAVQTHDARHEGSR